MVERKNSKGKKVDDEQAQVSCHLKNSAKTVFFVPKVPQKRGVIFCQPPFSGLFLREKKLFLARCEHEGVEEVRAH